MNKSIKEALYNWETKGLNNLHQINLDAIYAFPLTMSPDNSNDFGVQSILDNFNISRRLLIGTQNTEVKSLVADIDQEVLELTNLLWKLIVQTKIQHCGPEDKDFLESEFHQELENCYGLIYDKFEEISELLN